MTWISDSQDNLFSTNANICIFLLVIALSKTDQNPNQLVVLTGVIDKDSKHHYIDGFVLGYVPGPPIFLQTLIPSDS